MTCNSSFVRELLKVSLRIICLQHTDWAVLRNERFFSLLFLLVWGFFNCFSGVFVPITCFRERFLQKAIIYFVLPNVLFKVLLMFITCQCLFLAFLVLSNERLYVTEKGIMSARIGLEVFKSNLLLKLSTLLI